MDDITEGENALPKADDNPYTAPLTKKTLLERLHQDKLRILEQEGIPNSERKPKNTANLATRKISRRAVVTLGGVGLAALGLRIWKGEDMFNILAGNSSQKTENNLDQGLIHNPEVPQAPEAPKIAEYLIEDYKLLNEILAQPIDYPEPKPDKEFKLSKRQTKEKEYIDRCLAPDSDPKKKLERIDRGFMVIGDYKLRIQLLKERFKLRQEGNSGLRKITEEEITWAKSRIKEDFSEGIHPEVLAICTDAYFQTRELLFKLKAEKGDKFLRFMRPDLYLLKEKGDLTPELEAKLDNLSVDDILMNPGGMAELVCQETDPKIPPDKDNSGKIIKKYQRKGFAHIGHVAAKPQLKTNVEKETEKQAAERVKQEASLTEIIGIISKDTKIQTGPGEYIMLQYNEHRVPGSIAGEGDIRAGALGLQFMPATALSEYNFNKENFNIGFNPFGLEAVVGAYIMLSRGMISVDQDTGKKAYLRFGYLKGEYPRKGQEDLGKSLRHDAIERWNPHDFEIKQVLKAADDYYDKVIGPRVFEGKIVPMYENRPIVSRRS